MSALDPVGSIKTKLGVLVAVSVVVASLAATFGAAGGVPLWLTLPVTVVLALAVTQLLAAGMTAPLRDMTAAVQRMARGDYDARVTTTAVDEVGRLAVAFNQMASDLARVDAERRDLIATVSHELRTPVAAVTAQLENLADGVVESSPERLESVLVSARALGDLLVDLLDLSRLEAGVAPLDLETVALAGLVASSAEQVRAAGRGAPVSVAVPEALRVRVDPARLTQLLTNALDNAARHTPDGESVDVTAGELADGGWWLEVADAGPGVAPQDRERVFERFGTDASGGGTGLGLAVSRWVARLHGGTLGFVDPAPGKAGARLRLAVPSPVSGTSTAGRRELSPVEPVSQESSATPVETWAPMPPVGRTPFWAEERPEGDLRVVLGAVAVGTFAGATMTFTGPGLSWSLVMIAAGLVAWLASGRRTEPFTLATSVLALALVGLMAVRANPGLGMLGVLIAAGVFLGGLTRARTFRGMITSGFLWPASSIRGMGWFGRSLGMVGFGGRLPAVLRTLALSVVAVWIFAMLFAGADAVFAAWLDRVLPSWGFNELAGRIFVALGVFAVTLAAAYLARNPARVDPREDQVRVATNRWEWLVPVLGVDAVFAVFVSTQVAVVLGGHEYVERAAGLSYGSYVHQGFAQLVIVTLLAFVVVWAAGRHSARTPSDRWWLRLSVGLLTVLTLCVAAAALYRMWIYQDAYGFTTLRVLAIVFESWLALVVIAVMVLGLLGRTGWAARFALLSGATAVLLTLVANPDARVASANIARYDETGSLDVAYLASLSTDAAPVVLERLPQDLAACVLKASTWVDSGEASTSEERAWSWGNERGERAVVRFLEQHPDALATECAPHEYPASMP